MNRLYESAMNRLYESTNLRSRLFKKGNKRDEVKIFSEIEEYRIDINDRETLIWKGVSEQTSLEHRSYGETEERSHRYRPSALGGEVTMGKRSNGGNYTVEQQEVLRRLKDSGKAKRIFLSSIGDFDQFVVEVPDEDLSVNDELAKIFWDVYDLYPKYRFELEPIPSGIFDTTMLPPGNTEIPLEG